MSPRGLLARLLGWSACLALAWPPRSLPERAHGSFYERLSHPIAGLAASLLWVRFDWHWRMGRPGEALRAAERALAVDPQAEQGWIALAQHLAQDRASERLALDPEERGEWIAEGLAVLERGERHVRHPAELAFTRGLLLAQLARGLLHDASPPRWPGGAAAAFRAAQEAFERARDLGHRGAAEQLAGLERERAEADLER